MLTKTQYKLLKAANNYSSFNLELKAILNFHFSPI